MTDDEVIAAAAERGMVFNDDEHRHRARQPAWCWVRAAGAPPHMWFTSRDEAMRWMEDALERGRYG